jgi:hypothetical protein
MAIERGDLDAITVEEVRSVDTARVEGKSRDAIQASLTGLLKRRATSPAAVSAALAIDAAIALRDLVPTPDVAIEVARPLLEDEDRRVRYYALRLLALYPADRRVGEAATSLLDDPDPLIAGEARLILR